MGGRLDGPQKTARKSSSGYVPKRFIEAGDGDGVTDTSVTCASIIHITKLVQRVEQSEDANARELARRNAEALKHPDRRVGAALQPKKRGGVSEDLARKLEQRNADLLVLASLIAPGASSEQQARAIAGRLARYQPKPIETLPERRLMRKINDSGLPVGRQRISKILVEQKAALLNQ